MTHRTLSVEGIRKTYRKTVALDDVSFDIPQGTLTVILGPAGAGKTTTLRTIAGLERPDEGRVFLDGKDVTGLQPNKRNVAMIFDNLALYPNRTGRENMAYPLKVQGAPQSEIDARINELSEVLRVHHILDRKPKTMSGGERQRIALGRALIREPHLYLLDEPLSSLDAMLRLDLRAELKRLQREHSYTFLMATPDFSEALALADQVVMLREGRVRQVAPPQEIYNDPVDRDVAAFVGAPAINLLPSSYRSQISHGLSIGNLKLDWDARERPPDLPSFEAGIRPEDISVVRTGESDLIARVTDFEPQGLKSGLTLEIEGTEFRTLVGPEQGPAPQVGDEIGCQINTSKLLAFETSTGKRIRFGTGQTA